jgi:hypothetical protein
MHKVHQWYVSQLEASVSHRIVRNVELHKQQFLLEDSCIAAIGYMLWRAAYSACERAADDSSWQDPLNQFFQVENMQVETMHVTLLRGSSP